MLFYRYNIEDLHTERMYLVNIKILFCYETKKPQCDNTNMFTVLENTRLPKQHCDWSSHQSSSGKTKKLTGLVIQAFRVTTKN